MKYNSALIGKGKGKIGSLIASSWKGIGYFKEKAISVANPNTEGQRGTRSAFRQLVDMGRTILEGLGASFHEQTHKMTALNAFIKFNLSTAFTFASGVATLVADELVVSKGTLFNPSDMDLGSYTGRTAPITWTDRTTGVGKNGTDVLKVVVCNGNGEIYYLDGGATRADGSGSFTIPGATSAGTFSVHAFFLSADYAKASDSILLS